MSREHHKRDDLAARRDLHRHDKLRSTAMDAACALLCERPDTQLTMGTVAARAEVSETTLAALFSSVDELVAEVCLRAVRDVPYVPTIRGDTSCG